MMINQAMYSCSSWRRTALSDLMMSARPYYLKTTNTALYLYMLVLLMEIFHTPTMESDVAHLVPTPIYPEEINEPIK